MYFIYRIRVLIILRKGQILGVHILCVLYSKHSTNIGKTIWFDSRVRIEYMDREKWMPFSRKAGFCMGFTTLAHILTLQTLIDGHYRHLHTSLSLSLSLSLRRHFHSGSTYDRDLSKTKATIYLTWESHMRQKPYSRLFSFHLIYFYIHCVICTLFWCVLKDEKTLKM